MKRKDEWPQLLEHFVVSRREARFEWGAHDCCAFAARAIEAMTGENPAAKLPTYASEEEAMAIKDNAGGLLELPFSLGFQRVPVAFAQRGDLVAVETGERGPALGICLGRESAFASAVGVSFRETLSCSVAWRI